MRQCFRGRSSRRGSRFRATLPLFCRAELALENPGHDAGYADPFWRRSMSGKGPSSLPPSDGAGSARVSVCCSIPCRMSLCCCGTCWKGVAFSAHQPDGQMGTGWAFNSLTDVPTSRPSFVVRVCLDSPNNMPARVANLFLYVAPGCQTFPVRKGFLNELPDS